MKRGIMSLFSAIAVFMAFLPIMPTNAAASINLGDYVQMGTYYGEPILWRCVAFEKITGYDDNGNPIIDSTDTVTKYTDGYLPLMLSDKIICLKAYDADGSNITGSHSRSYRRQTYGSNYWGDSNMRSWLNSDESAGNVAWLCGNPPDEDHVSDGYDKYDQEAGFLTNFSQNELNAVMPVTQKQLLSMDDRLLDTTKAKTHHTYNYYISYVVQNYARCYAQYLTDKMFLPDVKQINTIYNNRDILGSSFCIGRPTAECVKNSEYTSSSLSNGGKWHYWLRSPGARGVINASYYYIYEVRYVDSEGNVSSAAANISRNGVRPAFYLNTGSSSIKSGSGAENSPYIVEGTGNTYVIDDTTDNTNTTSKLEFTATFETNGGSEVSAQKVGLNETVTEPAAPTRDGYIFSGWYADAACTEKFDFATKIFANTVLYAGWTTGGTTSEPNSSKSISMIIDKTEATVNGESVINDVAPIIANERTMLPARFVAENLGASVEWKAADQTVTVKDSETTVVITVNSDKATVNGESQTLDSPAFIANDRTYVPVRFLAESLRANVEWDEALRQVTITK